MNRRLFVGLVGASATLGGCDAIGSYLYYESMEKLGREKRDILARRVEAGRKEQVEAKEQFQTTLEAFQDLTGFEGGNLEKTYNQLNKEYERSETQAKQVGERIQAIDKVANDLFAEWEKEIGEIGSQDLQRRSRELLSETKGRYSQFISKMRDAEGKMEPVLSKFRDQVLFLKHNLNAAAIASLSETSLQIDSDVAALVSDIEASIAEADSFIASLETAS